jgi:hypothetical protein
VKGGGSLNLGKSCCDWVCYVPHDPASRRILCKFSIQEGKVAISFHLHSELDVLMDNIEKAKETLQFLRSLGPDDKDVAERSQRKGLRAGRQVQLLQILHVYVGMNTISELIPILFLCDLKFARQRRWYC